MGRLVQNQGKTFRKTSPQDEDSEGVPQDDSETADPEGDPDGSTLSNKDTPRSVYFEEPPDGFAPPTSNQPAEPPSQSEAADAALLLRYHYRYVHISFRRLNKMTEQGVITRHLKDIPTPACLACHYAKSTKRPWRHKSQKQYKPPPSNTKPGEVVSADQMVSPTPGIIA